MQYIHALEQYLKKRSYWSLKNAYKTQGWFNKLMYDLIKKGYEKPKNFQSRLIFIFLSSLVSLPNFICIVSHVHIASHNRFSFVAD